MKKLITRPMVRDKRTFCNSVFPVPMQKDKTWIDCDDKLTGFENRTQEGRNRTYLGIFRVPAWLCVVSLSFIVSACSIFGGKAAEEPVYRVVLEDGAIEIREYEAYAVAETLVNQSFDTATDVGFSRLFNYISGSNKESSNIAMTAPVFATPVKIPVKAPVVAVARSAGDSRVLTDDGSGGWTITFVLPNSYTTLTAPKPEDVNVTLRDVPASRVAAIRFSGRFRNEASELRRQELAAWLKVRGLKHEADWRMAGYNPPWTLPPFRRNEVIVTLQVQK